jgi:hypothetical protein
VHRTALADDGLDEAVAALRAFALVDRETSASHPSACARSASSPIALAADSLRERSTKMERRLLLYRGFALLTQPVDPAIRTTHTGQRIVECVQLTGT